MNDSQLIRYSRHILLDEIDIAGQTTLLTSHALIVGAGGLGAPAAMYLASAGVGHLTIADDDLVDLTNLQRQIIHQTQAIGQPKVLSAQNALHALNPDCRVYPVEARMDSTTLHALLPTVDVVLDCSDNFTTRHRVNAACSQHGVPLVSGAAVQWSGQLAVFDPRISDSPCYQCLFPDSGDDDIDMPCARLGVFSPLVGVIGSMQAAEALKILLGLPTTAGFLSLYDAKTSEWRRIRVPKDAACEVCGKVSSPPI